MLLALCINLHITNSVFMVTLPAVITFSSDRNSYYWKCTNQEFLKKNMFIIQYVGTQEISHTYSQVFKSFSVFLNTNTINWPHFNRWLILIDSIIYCANLKYKALNTQYVTWTIAYNIYGCGAYTIYMWG